METTPGILIRKYRYSDTSLIVVWITQHYGKIRTVAKGAFRPNSSLRGKLDLFYEADVCFVRARSGELHSLREVSLHHAFDSVGLRYANLALAAYFAELTDLVTESSTPAEGHYELLKRAVRFLRTEPASLRALVHFENELCRLLGIHHPSIEPVQALATHSGRIPDSRTTALKAMAG